MNWLRTILDGIVMCATFDFAIAFGWLNCPNSFSKMLPLEIQKVAPKRTKQEIKSLVCLIYPLYIGLIAYSILSAYSSGINGFWNLFWTSYIEMFVVNLGDFFGLDCFLREKSKNRIMIKGTENCKAWNTDIWLKSLAIPEHLLMWPLIVCPLFGFICAGIGMLIR